MKDIYLFNSIPLNSHLKEITRKVKDELLKSSNRILNENSSDLAEELADKYKQNAPSFDYDSLETTVIPRNVMHYRRPVMTHFVEYKFPFSGDKVLLECKPSTAACGIGYPVVVTVIGDKIAFEVNSQGIVTNGGQPMERVKMYAKAVFDYVDFSNESLTESINEWNGTLKEEIEAAIVDRKAQLQDLIDKKKEIEDGLNPFT